VDRTEQAKMISDVYARAYAAGIASNDPGVLPEAAAKKAVVGFIRMMKTLNAHNWAHYDEESI
jgi:hypothetical protein